MTLMNLIPMVSALLTLAVLTSSAGVQTGTVKVRQRHLVPLCLNGTPIEAEEREWALAAGTYTMALTMRNEPRSGVASGNATAPGIAAITFAVEAGHAYEVEVRAEAVSFSTRIWTRGKWRPVVRDRTVDRIVSSEPEWRDARASCGPQP